MSTQNKRTAGKAQAAPGIGDNSLDSIAGQIKALEKRTIADVAEIGRLLTEAFNQCAPGEYDPWLLANFGWSRRTAYRYRGVHTLVDQCQIGTANISLSALYLCAEYGLDDPRVEAILAAAKTGRVTYSAAKRIIDEHYDANSPANDAGDDDAGDADADDDDDDDDDAAGDGDDGADDGAGGGEEKKSADPSQSREKKSREWLVSALRSLHSALDHLKVDLQKVIVEVGPIEMREIVTRLQTALDEHASKNVVKAKADRTEAKAKSKYH